jgi:16S rRNA processing protein RimM
MARVAGQRRRTAPTPAPATGAGVAPVPDQPPAEPDLLVVGRIGKPQGIKGEVTVQVRTDDPATRFAVGSVLLTDPAERGPLTVDGVRWQNGRLMVAFAGVSDRNGAELLRETLLQVDARTLPPPEDEDEFHDHVLRGMTAVLVGGDPLGEVVDVLHLPHGDVLVVRRDEAGVEVLVPFVKAMVPVVDVAARRLEVEPPDGLLDLTDEAAAPDGSADPDGA